MNHAEMDELYELYTLGVLEWQLASVIDEHVATRCEYCLTHIQEALKTTAALASLAEMHRPSSAVRERVMAGIQPAAARSQRRFVLPLLIAASVAMAILFGWQTIRMNEELQRTAVVKQDTDAARAQIEAEQNRVKTARSQTDELNRDLRAARAEAASLQQTLSATRTQAAASQLARQNSQQIADRLQVENKTLTDKLTASQSEIAATRNQLASSQGSLSAAQAEAAGAASELATVRAELNRVTSERNILQAAVRILDQPQTRTVAFGSNEQAPHGRVLVGREGSLVFLASSLPQVASGRTLELWLVPKNGAPQAAGLLKTNESGDSLHVLPQKVDPSDFKALAVSEEPASGSSAPTTKPFLLVPLG